MRAEVAIAVRRGDDHLDVHRSPAGGGYWHLVWGGVEPDEGWHEAALRELQEKTGLVVDKLHPAGGFEYIRAEWEPQPGMQVEGRYYAAEAPVGWEPVLDPEHDNYRWCSLDEACELLFFSQPRELLRSL